MDRSVFESGALRLYLSYGLSGRKADSAQQPNSGTGCSGLWTQLWRTVYRSDDPDVYSADVSQRAVWMAGAENVSGSDTEVLLSGGDAGAVSGIVYAVLFRVFCFFSQCGLLSARDEKRALETVPALCMFRVCRDCGVLYFLSMCDGPAFCRQAGVRKDGC